MEARVEQARPQDRNLVAGLVHSYPFRVCFADTDAGGVMHHAAYLVAAERARTELLREMGFGQAELRKTHGILLAVAKVTAEYRRPALLDELVTFRSSLAGLGGASFDARQELWRPGKSQGDELLTTLGLRLVCLGENGRAARLPGELRDRLAACLLKGE